MKLDEAKENLEDFIEIDSNILYECYKTSYVDKLLKSIKTVLQALDNSIPKETIEGEKK